LPVEKEQQERSLLFGEIFSNLVHYLVAGDRNCLMAGPAKNKRRLMAPITAAMYLMILKRSRARHRSISMSREVARLLFETIPSFLSIN